MTICLVDSGGGAQERLHRRLVTIQSCPKQRGVMRVDGICLIDAARLGRHMHPKQRQVAVAGGQAQGLWARRIRPADAATQLAGAARQPCQVLFLRSCLSEAGAGRGG